MSKNIKSTSTEKSRAIFEKDAFNKIQGSFILLLSNLHELQSKNEWASVFEKPLALTDVENQIIEYGKNLENILSNPTESRTAEISNILDLRPAILEMERTLQVYNLYLQRIEYIISHVVYLQTAPPMAGDFEPNEDDRYRLIASCVAFVESSSNDERAERMRNILKCFPVKMAKEKYFDYIRAGLKELIPKNHPTLAQNILKLNQINFDPVAACAEQKYFREFISKLDKLYSDALDNTINSNLLYDEADKLLNEINLIRDNLFLVYESINFLTITINFVPEINYVFDGNFVLKDLFYAVKDGVDSEKELFDQRIEELLDTEANKIGTVIADSYKEAKKLALSLNESKKEIDEALNQTLQIWDVISYCFYENLLDVAFLLEETSSDTKSLSSKIDKAIDVLRVSLARELPKTQRILKNYFISTLPCTYTVKQFNEHLTQSLDISVSSANYVITSYKVYDILSNAGYSGPDEPQHKHDANCNCGHQH